MRCFIRNNIVFYNVSIQGDLYWMWGQVEIRTDLFVYQLFGQLMFFDNECGAIIGFRRAQVSLSFSSPTLESV